MLLICTGEPECEGETQLTEGDIIQLTCNVEFTGSGGDIAWYVGDERLDSEDHNELSILNIVFKETVSLTKQANNRFIHFRAIVKNNQMF